MNSLVYIHVPKCGGTSFGSALRLRFFYSQATIQLKKSRSLQMTLFPNATASNRINAEYQIRDVLLAQLMARKLRCISAHTRYHPDLHTKYEETCRFVTMLRDPVCRFISHYHYLQRHHPDPSRPDTLEAFLETKNAARLGSQFLFYFARTFSFDVNDIDGAIAQAKAALERFSVIGDISRPSAFQRKLRLLVPLPLPILQRNQAPRSAARASGDLLRKVTHLCAADIAIYDHAQSLPQCA